MHAYHVPHAEHMEIYQSDKRKFVVEMMSRILKTSVLSSIYPIHGLLNEVNHSGSDMQVISGVVFHSFVEQLNILSWRCMLVLVLSCVCVCTLILFCFYT